MAMLRADRERGYAASNGFHEPGVGVVAAPVRDASLQIVAAINAVAVGDHGSGMEQATSHVLAAARELSRLLGAPATMPEAGDTLLERQI